MAYLNQLKWQKQLEEYSDNERKVLMVLSHEKYRWRTRDRISKISGLSESEVDKILSELIEKNKVRPSISKKKNVIFGLIERVG